MTDLLSAHVRAFAGDSEMARRMNALDWSCTAVGPIETWPERLRTVVDICLASRFPIVTWWGREAKTMFYNDGYIPMLGRTKHPQWLGRPGYECWRDIWSTVGPMLDSVFETGEATWSEDLLLVMDRNVPHEEAYFTFSYSPIPVADGSVAGVFCAVQETTERVLAERRLATLRDLGRPVLGTRSEKDSCERAARTMAQNPHDIPFALIYLFDSEHTHVELAALSGLSAGHHAAPQSVDLASRDDDGAWPFALAARAEAPLLVESLAEKLRDPLTDSLGERPDRAVILPLLSPSQNDVTGFLVAGVSPRRPLDDAYNDFLNLAAGHVATAIADARAYEEERARAEALAEIDRAKTAFFSNVSHEFRTPLTLLLGPIEEAVEHLDAPTDERRERLVVAQRNALRLQRLVNNLLDFSRIEAGRVQASYEPVDLAAYTAELASMFRAAFDRAGLELRVDCPPLTEPVYVDREMWEKVVMNLLSNAFKFTFEGHVTVGMRTAGRHVEITVRDTGVGVPPAELPKLFDRFHRVPTARARTHEGSGIGLSLVQELVRLHGGEVHAASTPGEGSAFTITLPFGSSHLPHDRLAAPRTLQSTGSAPAAYIEEALRWLPDTDTTYGSAAVDDRDAGATTTIAAEVAGARLLVADDNADMRNYLRRILAAHWRVETVADGRRALDAIRSHPPDLLITDVMMPGLDGFELIEALRADPATAALPVIILSARAGEEARVEGLARGADDYLVKPFASRELVARVAARLEIAQLARQSEAALRQQREDLYNVIMQAPVAMYTIRGDDLTFEFINRPALDILGVDSAAGKPLLDVLPELDGQGYVDLLKRVMRTGEPYVGREIPLQVTREGTSQDDYVTFVYAPLRNSAGDVDGIIGVTTVVTEEVRARQRLEEVNAQLREVNAELRHQRADLERFTALVEGSSDYVGMAHVDGEVFYLNRAARELMGLAPGQIPPRSIEEYIAPESWPHVRDIAIPAVIETGEWRGEIVLRNFATGELIEMDQIIFLAKDSAGETSLATVGRDMRERKAMEDELRRLNAAKDDFLSMVSHELRTPITTIMGNAQVLRVRARHLDDESRASALWDIETEAVRLNRIIANLLLLARLDRGEIPSSEPLFAEREIARAVAEYQKQHPGREIRVDGDGDAPVLAEAGYFEQIISNLLTNAGKYSPLREPIDVSVRREGGQAIIAVRDRGIGIAPQDAEAVFTPFYRSERSAKQVQGMGIGLAVCKRLVEAQDGRIWMEPLPEGGTRVCFTLPLEHDDWDGGA